MLCVVLHVARCVLCATAVPEGLLPAGLVTVGISAGLHGATGYRQHWSHQPSAAVCLSGLHHSTITQSPQSHSYGAALGLAAMASSHYNMLTL